MVSQVGETAGSETCYPTHWTGMPLPMPLLATGLGSRVTKCRTTHQPPSNPIQCKECGGRNRGASGLPLSHSQAAGVDFPRPDADRQPKLEQTFRPYSLLCPLIVARHDDAPLPADRFDHAVVAAHDYDRIG